MDPGWVAAATEERVAWREPAAMRSGGVGPVRSLAALLRPPQDDAVLAPLPAVVLAAVPAGPTALAPPPDHVPGASPAGGPRVDAPRVAYSLRWR